MDLIFFVWCEKESMEHVMDLPCFGEVELVHYQRQDLDDYEGLFMLRSKFRVCDRPF